MILQNEWARIAGCISSFPGNTTRLRLHLTARSIPPLSGGSIRFLHSRQAVPQSRGSRRAIQNGAGPPYKRCCGQIFDKYGIFRPQGTLKGKNCWHFFTPDNAAFYGHETIAESVGLSARNMATSLSRQLLGGEEFTSCTAMRRSDCARGGEVIERCGLGRRELLSRHMR